MSCVLCGTYKDIKRDRAKFDRLVLTAYYIGSRGDALELCQGHQDLLSAVEATVEVTAKEEGR